MRPSLIHSVHGEGENPSLSLFFLSLKWLLAPVKHSFTLQNKMMFHGNRWHWLSFHIWTTDRDLIVCHQFTRPSWPYGEPVIGFFFNAQTPTWYLTCPMNLMSGSGVELKPSNLFIAMCIVKLVVANVHRIYSFWIERKQKEIKQWNNLICLYVVWIAFRVL